MDEFKTLEEIGLKEVSNKTHIETKNLEYMINSQFDKLNRASTIGFAKILTRDYKLELTDWLNEAEKFWSANKIEDDGVKIFIVKKQRNFVKFLFIILLMFVLVAILYGAYVFLNKKQDLFQNPLVGTDTNYTYEHTPVVNEAKETLEKNITQDENNTTTEIDINQSINNELNKTNTAKAGDINNSIVKSIQEQNTSVVDKNTTNSKRVKETDDYISPKSKLWLGIIYLDNFKRKSFLGTNNFALDASRDQIITTGHGNFNLYFNGELKKFRSQNPIRLYIKSGQISVITDKKFKELNKGSRW